MAVYLRVVEPAPGQEEKDNPNARQLFTLIMGGLTIGGIAAAVISLVLHYGASVVMHWVTTVYTTVLAVALTVYYLRLPREVPTDEEEPVFPSNLCLAAIGAAGFAIVVVLAVIGGVYLIYLGSSR